MRRRHGTAYGDPELVELLRDEPELLAIADALMDTHGRPRGLGRFGAAARRVATGRGTGMRRSFALALVGVTAMVAGVLAIRGAVSPQGAATGSAAAAAAEADGGPAAPNALMQLRQAGGPNQKVTFSEIARAHKQALAISSAGGSWQYAGANNIGGRVTDVV